MLDKMGNTHHSGRFVLTANFEKEEDTSGMGIIPIPHY